jgi:hypothetical protein
MSDIVGDLAVPDPAERARRNAALAAHGTETGFWDDHGRPAPWPDDIDCWQPETGGPRVMRPDVSGLLLDAMFQGGQVGGHLLDGLAAHDEGNQELPDPVAGEVDADSQL